LEVPVLAAIVLSVADCGGGLAQRRLLRVTVLPRGLVFSRSSESQGE
jgi:hypothetical protein